MLEVIILALALSMDAFAVALAISIKSEVDKKHKNILAFKVAILFGLAQGIMPLFGYLLSLSFGSFIESVDHFIAFFLLFIIGSKMLYDSFQNEVEEEISKLNNKVLFLLAIATSIDAMAAGFTLDLLKLNAYVSMLIIAIVTFIMTFLAVLLASKKISFLENQAERAGGIVLIILGSKILIEHTLF